MFFVDEEGNDKLKKCDKYVFFYNTFTALLVADLFAGMALDGARPDILKKLIVAGVILAVGSVASILGYFRVLDKVIKQQNPNPRKKGDFKISRKLNKLLDSVVYNNER